METQAYIKNIHISPKKLRFFLEAVKKMQPKDVLHHLFYSRNKAGKVFYHAVKTAMENAKQTLKVEEDKLSFKTIIVEEGQKLRRFRAGGRGVAKPYIRRFSHIKIILTAPKSVVIETPKKEESKKVEVKVKKQKKA